MEETTTTGTPEAEVPTGTPEELGTAATEPEVEGGPEREAEQPNPLQGELEAVRAELLGIKQSAEERNRKLRELEEENQRLQASRPAFDVASFLTEDVTPAPAPALPAFPAPPYRQPAAVPTYGEEVPGSQDQDIVLWGLSQLMSKVEGLERTQKVNEQKSAIARQDAELRAHKDYDPEACAKLVKAGYAGNLKAAYLMHRGARADQQREEGRQEEVARQAKAAAVNRTTAPVAGMLSASPTATNGPSTIALEDQNGNPALTVERYGALLEKGWVKATDATGRPVLTRRRGG